VHLRIVWTADGVNGLCGAAAQSAAVSVGGIDRYSSCQTIVGEDATRKVPRRFQAAKVSANRRYIVHGQLGQNTPLVLDSADLRPPGVTALLVFIGATEVHRSIYSRVLVLLLVQGRSSK